MNLKQKLREELFKKSKRKYDYGCVMVYLNLDGDKWTDIQKMIEDKDIYNGEGDTEGTFGRELDPHITILFGIHADVPDEDVEKYIEKIKTPEIELNKISIFENELFDVLKFDVKSDDLHELNKDFKKLPHTSDYPNYHPHTTICYLKKGLGKEYMKKMKDVEPIQIDVDKIVYSKSDGSKKEYSL